MDDTSRSIDITLKDGSVVQYSMRGLKDDDEVRTWAKFCASVFSYKSNPPPASYFERHYYNDPDRNNASLIRVMLYKNKIVSSCRIFQRQISTRRCCQQDDGGEGPAEVCSSAAGGVGEVCTDAQHRYRGLSKLLLQNAIDIMKQLGMKQSLLHSAPEFYPVYEKNGGYQCVPSRWCVLTFSQSNLQKKTSALNDQSLAIRLAQFPNDTARLRTIHHKYSERRFVGCIIRSEAYWNEYISKELEGTLWTLAKKENDSAIAWLSLRFRAGRYQMRDFGCDTDSISVAEALALLIVAALPHDDSNSSDQVKIYLPTAILKDATSLKDTLFNIGMGVTHESDNGWMYKTLSSDEEPMVDATKTCNHLIWPVDSF